VTAARVQGPALDAFAICNGCDFDDAHAGCPAGYCDGCCGGRCGGEA
jgi:hypothetical protein